MSVRKRNVDKSGTVESPTVMQTLSKAFVAKSAWEDKVKTAYSYDTIEPAKTPIKIHLLVF